MLYRRDFSCDLRPVSSSSPRVSLQANVLLRAGISCLGPASAAPCFNQALGSEIWAWRAGCTRAPFIWFQSSLRPRMWPRGHSFSRHWGVGVGRSGAEQHKGQAYLFGGACLRVCFCIAVRRQGLTNSGYFKKAFLWCSEMDEKDARKPPRAIYSFTLFMADL